MGKSGTTFCRRIKLFTAVLLSALLVAQGTPPSLASVGGYGEQTLTEADFKSELDAINKTLQDVEKQRKAINSQISEAKDEKQKKLMEKTQWEHSIQVTKDEIGALENRIDVLERQADIKSGEIEKKQSDISENYEQYKRRMRAMYMAGEASTLSMVLGASDFTDFLMRTEMVRATAEHDKNLLGRLRTDREELEAARASLEESKRLLEQDNTRMSEKKGQLESELTATQNAIEDIAMLEQEYASRKAELDAQDKAAQAALDKIYAQIDNSTEFVGGTFGWPVPGFQNISSHYGWRFGGTNFHTGMDISGGPGGGIFGASIRASNSGTVVFVQHNYTPGVNYGKYAIVDHGGGYSTLYAHMTSITAKVGDRVTRGISEIGKVGSTGWSTGPHLHFEIRVNGKHQNPLNFLKG